MTGLADNSIKAKLLEAQKERCKRMSRVQNEDTESPNKKLRSKFESLQHLEEQKTSDSKITQVELAKEKVIARRRLKKNHCSPTRIFNAAEFIKQQLSGQPQSGLVAEETLDQFEKMCSICMENIKDKT